MSNLNNYSNELEARFRLRIFSILKSQEALKQIISNDPSFNIDQNKSFLRLELGRFLAGYYLNYSFPLFFKNIEKLDIKEEINNNFCLLPNLIIWSELEDQWLENNKKEEKEQNNHWNLGQLLSEYYSPKLAIYLLLRENKILEAIFFVDNFNDLKAALILRFLAEKIYNIQLLWDFCQNLLIDQFLENILFFDEDYDDFSQISNNNQEYIQKHLEAILNIDILFSNNFNNNSINFFDSLISKCAYYMGAEFGNILNNFCFDNKIIFSLNYIKNFSQLLPLPPLFLLLKEDNNFNLFNKNNLEKFKELKSWLILNKCYLIINIAFGINNRLENLIEFFALWMAQNQENNNYGGNELTSDFSIIFEKELFINYSEQEIRLDLNIFQTLFSVIIGMQLYDLLIQSINNNNELIINKYKTKLNIISIPFKNDYYFDNEKQKEENNELLIWENIKKWIRMAEKEDLDLASLLLHTLQQQNQRYFKKNFPPLININRPKWYSHFLYCVEEENNYNLNKINENINLDVFYLNNNKFQLNNFEDILILRYLSKYFPFISINSKTIQICLNINPDDFCYFNTPIESLNKNEKFNLLGNSLKKENKLITKEEIDEIELLTKEIRLGIKRLELLGEEQKVENKKEIIEEEYVNNEIISVKQYKNNNQKRFKQLKNKNKLSKFNNKNKQYSINKSDLDKKQNTYATFLSLLLKQKGIKENNKEEELSTTEPIKSSSNDLINYYYSSSTYSSSYNNNNKKKEKLIKNNNKINNKIIYSSEEEESTSSNNNNNWESEEEKEENNNKELTKEQILQEMNKIEKHLEWIWEQIGNKINNEEEEEEEEINKNNNNEDNKNQKEEEKKEIKESEFLQNKEDEKDKLNNEISTVKEIENNETKKHFKIPEIRIKSQIDFSIPSLIEEEKSFELKEEEENEKILNNNNNNEYNSSSSSFCYSDSSVIKNDLTFKNWSIPPNILPMDFSRLNIDSDDDYNDKKYKWKEIEVYPRDNNLLKEKEKLSKQKLILKNKWRPPNWLRLLPPFDGTIKTERIFSNKIKTERQFLQLNLNKKGRQKTFLDISTNNNKEYSFKKIKNKENIVNEEKQSSFYDSGIVLDQTIKNSQDLLLYSIELNEEEIENMRKMAK